MKQIFVVAVIFTFAFVNSSIYTRFKDTFPNHDSDKKQQESARNSFVAALDLEDVRIAKNKADLISRLKSKSKHFDNIQALTKRPTYEEQKFNRDLRLNQLRSRDGRRREDLDDRSSASVSSSSIEGPNWKDEWKEHWLLKKIEAINSSVPKGDMVNMVAARPWGVPCGDPNQYDAPWGTCMLPVECESEFRIFRGDYFCGRTKFVCCALLVTNYDLYAGFDVSFDDSSLGTSSDEKKNRDRGTQEKKRRKKKKNQKRRRRDRLKRKRKIKRDIKKILQEITKILHRSFRNGTSARKKKTRQLKKFIKYLKRKYKNDRKAVKDIHEIELVKVDAALQKRLDEIRAMNEQYVQNSTFRDIIVNGTISKKNLKMLVKAYPELNDMLETRRTAKQIDDMNFDVEYGILYY